MYIIDLKINQYSFKRAVETNNIIKVMEELPNILQRIEDEYFIEIDDKTLVIDKIERFD